MQMRCVNTNWRKESWEGWEGWEDWMKVGWMGTGKGGGVPQGFLIAFAPKAGDQSGPLHVCVGVDQPSAFKCAFNCVGCGSVVNYRRQKYIS